MCRSIKNLYNYDPSATEAEIYSASLQFARKISGMKKPAKNNEEVFNNAVEDFTSAATILLSSLKTNSPTKSREVEAEKAKIRSAKKFQN